MKQTLVDERAVLLSRVELFAGLDRVTLAKLAARLEPVSVADGDSLTRQGDPPDALYLISRGSFGIFVTGPEGSEETPLGACSRGDVVGEMGLLTDEGRSATVRVAGDGEALRLSRAHFLDLVRQEPSVALAIAATLSRRLRAANEARVGISGYGLAAPAPTTAGPLPEPETAAGAAARRLWWQERKSVGFALAGVVLALGWATSPPPELSPAGWHALAALLAIVPLLALDALSDGAVALGLVAVWVIGGVAPARVALGGFATGSWVLIVSIFAIGAAVAACGLLYRLALWVVLQARGSYSGQVAGLGLAGLLIGPAVPNATARVSFIAPAITEMAEALGYPPGSRAAAGLAMTVLVGFGQMVGTFPTSSSTALLAFAVLPEAARSGLDWGTWILRALPAHAIILLGLLAAVLWLYRPARRDGQSGPASDALALQRTLLGPPSRREWIAALVVVFLLMGFVTQPLHGVDPAWVGVVAFVTLTATGVVTAETLRAVNWNFVLLFGVLASMGEVFASTKLDQWLAGLVAGLLGGLASAPILFVGVLALVCFGLSLVLRWQAAVPLLTITLAPLAGGAGIDPWVVAMVALLACNGFWLPHQSTIYLALYHGTGGRLFSHEQAHPVALAYWLLTLLGLCASVPFWHALGLL